MGPKPIAYPTPKAVKPKPVPAPAPAKPKVTTPKPVTPKAPVVSGGGRSNAPPRAGTPGWKEYTAARWHKKHDGVIPTSTYKATPVAVAAPEDPIMTLFRSTLDQIKSSATPVDDAAIRKPYDDASVVAGGLGGGLAAAELDNYGKTQAQYTAARGDAQGQAASFGIANGAGTAGAGLGGDSSGMLAQQSQAQQNAAVGAASAWQQLLNRVGTAAVTKAHSDQQTDIDRASESLAASLPGMYQAQDTLNLQRDTAEANNRYLLSSLDAKQRQFYQSDATTRRGQDVSTANNKRSVQGANDRSDASIEAENQRSANTIQAANDRNAATIKGASQRAALQKKSGVKGTDKVLKLITPATVKDDRKLTGHWVTYVADPTGVNAGATPTRQYVPVGQSAPTLEGYTAGNAANGLPVYAPAKSGKKATTGVTLKAWNEGVGIYMNENGWTRAQAQKYMQRLTPKPKK